MQGHGGKGIGARALHDHFYLKSINKMSLLFITKIECYMIYLNKCFIKAEPNIEFLVVFSGRLGVRLREDWRETRSKTEGGLGEGFESQIINSTGLNSVVS